MAVFYSFHYERDNWRVQQIMNMGILDGQPLLNSQKWEEVKRQGSAAIENWIGTQMAYKSAVVVLAGTETADRPWVRYEIIKAWNDKRRLVGIQIHGLEDRHGARAHVGANPFSKISLSNGRTIAEYVPLHTPTGWDSKSVYNDIKTNLRSWVDSAYRRP